MDTMPSRENPARPGLISCFRTGFDTVANHIWVILIPVVIDLAIWWGPHLRFKGILDEAATAMLALLEDQATVPPEMLQANQALWQAVAERFNLLTLVRTLPVGVPSLMSGRYPLQTPFGAPLFIELSSSLSIVMVALAAVALGLLLGALYYLLIAQLASQGRIDWRKILQDWPRALFRSALLTLLFIGVIALITIPFSCFLSLLAVSGLGANSLGTLVYGILLAWWLFPLVFSAHGVFLFGEKVAKSIRRSIRFTRLTFPVTGLLIVIILVLAEGLDYLWNTPLENSWLLLLGIAGHAFITTAMLETSFIYYKDMNRVILSAS